MRRVLLLSVVVMVSACTANDPKPLYPPSYPRQTTREPDTLGDINREARSARSLLGNILGMKRDLSR